MDPLTVLPQEPRNGSFTTSSVAVPVGATQASVVCPMSDADAQNPALSCRITLSGTYDGGLSWQPFGAPYDWQGGLSPRDGSFTKPTETVALPDPPPQSVRVMLDTLGNTLDTGVTLGAG